MNYNHLTLIVTEKCNLCCEYCFESEQRKAGVMSDETFKTAINMLKPYDQNKSITFFGGEPLLVWDKIITWINWIVKNDIKIGMSITTNGMLIDEKINQFLIDNKVGILLSIDGYGEEANQLRVEKLGVCVWKKWYHNISLIEDRQHFKIRMTITPKNAIFLSESVKSFVEYGIRNIAFAFDYTSIWLKKDIEAYKEEYRKILYFFKSQYLLGNRIHIDLIDRLLNSGIKRNYTKCRLVTDSLSIMPNGDMKICHRSDYPVANIFMNDRIIEDKIMKYVDCSFEMLECRQCQLMKRCVLCSFLLDTDDESQKEMICQMNQFHIFSTDKMIEEMYHSKNKGFEKEFYFI